MKTDILLDAVGMISDEIIIDARLPKRRSRVSLLPKAAIAAAVTAAVILSSLSAAANNESSYKILYAVSPAAAQEFKSVKMSCEDNGIEMEVISTYVHENKAEIYISLKDTVGGRIDKTTDLFDSCSINTPFDCSTSCTLAEYDEETHTAFFLISVSQWGNKSAANDKITFSVKKILSNKKHFSGALLEIGSNEISMEPPTVSSVAYRGASYRGTEEPDHTSFNYLLPNGEPLYSDNGVFVSAAGFVDGRLHIQLYFEDILNTDNHGSVYFIDGEGNEIYCICDISFWDDERCGSYSELIFDIPPEKLSDCTVYGEFVSCGNEINGNWQVTFPLKETPQK